MKRAMLLVMTLGIASACFAKAYYAGKREMVREAGCIVIVNITMVETKDRKEKPSGYAQKASATVERCLKGGVKGEIEIYGMGTFICAQCRYQTGRFILFLRKARGFWLGSNWHLGIRPIKGSKVQWFKDDKNLFETKDTPLDEVINEITTILEEQNRETPDSR